MGGYRDVKVCPKVPNKVREEIKEYMLKKNEFKTQINHKASMVNLVDNDEMDDDELEVNINANGASLKASKDAFK